MWRIIPVLLLLVPLATTGDARQISTGPTPSMPLDSATVTSVLERVRQDVGFYQAQAAEWRRQHPDPATLDAEGKPLPLVCPIADMDFEIRRVAIRLEVFSGRTASGEIALQVPLIGRPGPGGQADEHSETTQRLAFDRFLPPGTETGVLTPPLAAARAAAEQHERSSVTPIADTLMLLRRGMIAAAQQKPCFASTDARKHSDDTLDMDFVVSKDRSAEIGFNLVLVSAKGALAEQRRAVHSIKVVFEPVQAGN